MAKQDQKNSTICRQARLRENQFQIQQTNNVHKVVKRCLIDQYKQEWHEQLQLSNKGKTYNSFKANLEFENYHKVLPRPEYLPIILIDLLIGVLRRIDIWGHLARKEVIFKK